MVNIASGKACFIHVKFLVGACMCLCNASGLWVEMTVAEELWVEHVSSRMSCSVKCGMHTPR